MTRAVSLTPRSACPSSPNSQIFTHVTRVLPRRHVWPCPMTIATCTYLLGLNSHPQSLYIYLQTHKAFPNSQFHEILISMAMESSLCQSLCSSHPSSIPRQILRHHRASTLLMTATPRGRPRWSQKGIADHRGMAVECMNLESAPVMAKVETELEDEMIAIATEAAELMKAGRLSEKCGESGGMMEILECLEREAIMGEDQGRDPDDYNRRAQIFDMSSRVFQALKERNSITSANDHRES